MTLPSADEQMRRITEKTAEVFPVDEMRKKVEKSLATGRPLRAKLGVDPTSPDITLGNGVPLWKLRTFQELGHVAVLIIGDYTAQVGDPSGRNALRPMLTKEQVGAFAQTYLDQVGKILLPERLEIRRNSEWLAPLSTTDVLKLMGRVTVSQMLERDDFHKRFEDEVPISLHEFLYPLLQGWDSVVVRADVELGGTDQRFNLLMGRDLQRAEGQEPQALVINPLVSGTDGAKKMSKSTGNYIGVTESADVMFQKVMAMKNANDLMRDWFTFFTDVPPDRVSQWCDFTTTNARDAQRALGEAIVARYHGQDAATGVAARFQEHGGTNVRVITGGKDAVRPATWAEILVANELAKSKSEAARLIEQGAVSVNDQRVTDPRANFDAPPGALVRVGKNKFARVGPR